VLHFGRRQTPAVSENIYPSVYGQGYDRANRMFSNDKAETPEAMARETDGNQSAFAELQTFLVNNLPTAGSRVAHDGKKPWSPAHPEPEDGGGQAGSARQALEMEVGLWHF